MSAADERWAVVLRRDERADDEFVYSVTTTGVYSRPSCAARPARRENVVFFETAEQAERAGFRPCRRCAPDRPSAPARHTALVVQACGHIDAGIERGVAAAGPPSLDNLAARAGLSRFHFHRLFKKVTGITPHAYLATSRARRVRAELLRAPSITDAIYNAGFNSNGRFYAAAPEILGMTPTRFRDGGKGEVVRYCVAGDTHGVTLVALAGKGVCDVVVAGDRAAALRSLRGTFPKAVLVAGGDWLAARAQRTISSINAGVVNHALPEIIRGTVLDFLVREAFRNVVVLPRDGARVPCGQAAGLTG